MDRKLNDTKPLELLQSDYYVRMMLPDAEVKARPYVYEERRNLLRTMKSIKGLNAYNFVVVGAGTLWYIDIAYRVTKKYIAVEPLADIFVPSQVRFLLTNIKNVGVINKNFGEFSKSLLGVNNSLFVFHFNILSYIPDPIKLINKYIKTGDVLYISTWGTSREANTARNEYFNFINTGFLRNDFKIDPDSKLGLCNLDVFPFKELKTYKSYKRIKGSITDILIIYI